MPTSGAQEFSTPVSAPVPVCFATITDFARYPEWFSSIDGAAVLDRYPGGLARRVEFQIDMRLKRMRYVLAYEYDRPHALTWQAIDGDLDAIRGDYAFEKLGPNHTQATCRQAVSFGFWVPGPLRKAMEAHALRQSVLEFKTAAEAMARAAATPRGRKRAAK